MWSNGKFYLLDYGEKGVEQRCTDDLRDETLFERYLRARP